MSKHGLQRHISDKTISGLANRRPSSRGVHDETSKRHPTAVWPQRTRDTYVGLRRGCRCWRRRLRCSNPWPAGRGFPGRASAGGCCCWPQSRGRRLRVDHDARRCPVAVALQRRRRRRRLASQGRHEEARRGCCVLRRGRRRSPGGAAVACLLLELDRPLGDLLSRRPVEALLHRGRLDTIDDLPDLPPLPHLGVVLEGRPVLISRVSSVSTSKRRGRPTNPRPYVAASVAHRLFGHAVQALPRRELLVVTVDLHILHSLALRTLACPPLLLRMRRAVLDHPRLMARFLQVVDEIDAILESVHAAKIHVDGTSSKCARILQETHHVPIRPKDAALFQALRILHAT
mmetsp:Transcript_59944/g.154872  ORF Transcript_59944/g.154872 Transcript_59944/m.154872 type:complete len:345 (+) Transcript_59944:13-1047(+)